MISEPKTGRLERVVISGAAHEGLTITTRDGRRARLAVVDDAGNIIEAGPHVEREAYAIAVGVYRNFLVGKVHIRVQSDAPGSAELRAAGT